MLFRKPDKKMKRSHNRSLPRSSRSIPPVDPCRAFGKVSSGISLKGSLTVECAGLLPWFLLAMVTIIGFMELYQIQTEQLLSLCDKAKQAGMYAYVAERETADGEITLPSVRCYESPIGVLPLPKVWLKNTVTVHTWTGYQKVRDPEEAEMPEEMVYITDTGGVYHTNFSCRHLKLTIRQTTAGQCQKLRNQNGEKYYPCERCCSQTHGTGGFVYITETGNRFHSEAGCGGLKRTVRLIKRSQIPSLSECRDCKAYG